MIFAIGVAGFLILFALVPPDAPERGALVTLIVGAVGSATTYVVGRRLDRIETKTDVVVEQTNGQDQPAVGGEGGRSAHPPAARHGADPR